MTPDPSAVPLNVWLQGPGGDALLLVPNLVAIIILGAIAVVFGLAVVAGAVMGRGS